MMPGKKQTNCLGYPLVGQTKIGIMICNLLCQGERRAVQQRGADEEVYANLRARPPEPKEVLRPQRHLPLPG